VGKGRLPSLLPVFDMLKNIVNYYRGVLSPLGELRGKLQYTVHLRLIGKLVLVVGFLFVLTEFISLSVTAKALYERIDAGLDTDDFLNVTYLSKDDSLLKFV